jgi:CheY-like chemotaxis protein
LILLDLNLPLRNGLELLTQLKSDPELRKIPVVVLTTSAKESDIERAYDLQASGYIVKPLDLRRFVEILQAIESYWVDIVQLPPAQNAPLRIMRPQ